MPFDGEIRFNTRIDNSHVRKDLDKVGKEAQKDAKSTADEMTAAHKKAADGMAAEYKKAWDELRKTGVSSSKKVGKSLREDIGGSAQVVCGQLGGLKSVLWKLGSSIATAFSVAAIANFAKESVQAANQLTNALTGLQSILDGQGRSFSAAKKFLEEYTADGLIPMTNAITAYKNLASRGYDDTQIQQTLQALKDASAFGRQASYSMGEAVESATEGLKNENSILVDNAGVTKNVAKMWDEYAASIGTTANNLTQQQKIQAEVNGILEESKYQAGDAAKVAGTLSGQLAQLSVNFNNLKVAVGNALGPIVQSFLPVINAAVAALTRFANTVASVVAALFGSSVNISAEAAQEVADGFNSAAEGADNLTESTKAAGKAAKKYLAGFDEINKMSSPSSSGGGSGGSAASGGAVAVGTKITADGEVKDELSPKVQAIIDKIHQLIEPLKNIDFGPAVAAFGRLGAAVGGLGTIILDALEWAWFNILVPLATWTIEEGGPAAIDVFAAAVGLLNEVLGVLVPLGQWFWDAFLKPIAEWTGGVIVTVLKGLAAALNKISDWIAAHRGAVEAITIAVLSFMAAWKIVELAQLIGGIVSALATFITTGELATFITTALGAAVGFLTSPITLTVAAIGALIAIIVLLVKNWDTVKETAANVWAAIQAIWGGISIWFQDQVLDPLTAGFKGMVNGVIGFLNGMIRGIVTGVNTAIRAVNKLSFDVPSWVPCIGGSTFGFNLKTITYPQIPYLAKGAVLPANNPFLAVVGDQRHGTNVEAPLTTIQEAVAVVMSDVISAMLAGDEALLQELQELRATVENIQVGDSTIGEAADRYARRMALRTGGST